MEQREVEEFIAACAKAVAPNERAASEAWWELATTGTEGAQRAAVEAGLAYNEVFSEPKDFERVRHFHERREELPGHVGRQVEILYRAFAACQGDRGTIERIEELEARANSIYSNHRASVSGGEVGENEVRDILRSSEDVDLRREAWEASKTVGREVEDTVRELARLRNRLAREQGYKDHYVRSLDLQEIEPEELERIMSSLKEATDAPFREFKEQMDDSLRRRFGIGEIEETGEEERVMPWHLSDPFFQSCKKEAADLLGPPADLERWFSQEDLVALTRKTYDALGLEVRDVVSHSDLSERPGKDQHAFCLHVGREYPYDVRVLANVRPDHYWMDTLLHEFGHAVYDKHIDPSLPYFLRSVAHTNTTEAIALMMGSLADDAAWLSGVAGVEIEGSEAEKLYRINRLDKLLFVRWALVVYRFERALYADPDRADLNGLWWDLVEELQLLKRPEGRDEPDWAAKIHIATVPVYYHNYVIGELVATQLRDYIEGNVTRGPFFESEQAGRYLIEAIFGPGAREDWRDTVLRATDEPLNPKHFVDSLGGTAL